jgi:hypothetical protein
MTNTSPIVQELRLALRAWTEAQTDTEREAAQARVELAKQAMRADRIARGIATQRPTKPPTIPQNVLRTAAEERLAYLERAERGGAVGRSHCPPFAPTGKRLAREGLLTLERTQVSARCTYSIVVLTDKGRSALAKLRRRLKVQAPTETV